MLFPPTWDFKWHCSPTAWGVGNGMAEGTQAVPLCQIGADKMHSRCQDPSRGHHQPRTELLCPGWEARIVPASLNEELEGQEQEVKLPTQAPVLLVMVRACSCPLSETTCHAQGNNKKPLQCKVHLSGIQKTHVLMPVPPVSTCVTPSQSINFSGPPVFHLQKWWI